jgi:putative endonuclease
MAKHNQVGEMGEELAAAWFIQNGFEILERNWRFKNAEIDIVATFNSILHFIEVKTATTEKFGNPEQKVTDKKLATIKRAAEEYLHLNPQWQKIQFNVLAISMLPNQPIEYFYIEDVF